MKKINLMVNLVRLEYSLLKLNPYDFFLAKKEKIFQNISNKTEEQKIILLVILSFLLLDLTIICSNTFDILAIFKFFPDFLISEKWNIYLSFLLIQSLLKFIVLSYYNLNNTWHNIKTSLPYFGGFYAIYFFMHKKKKP